MKSQYFKTRKAFDFNAHPYALGNILGIRPGYEDNHFLLKIYGLEEPMYEYYYRYHLDDYLSKSADNKEKYFFAHIWHIISDRISYFQGRDPFSSKHALYLSNIEKLKSFQSFLSPKDKWNIRPNEVLLMEKDNLIAELREKIEALEEKLSKLEDFEVSVKAMVQDDHLPTFIDLIHQLKDLTLPQWPKTVEIRLRKSLLQTCRHVFLLRGKGHTN